MSDELRVSINTVQIASINYRTAYERLDIEAGHECQNYKDIKCELSDGDRAGWMNCSDELYMFIRNWAKGVIED